MSVEAFLRKKELEGLSPISLENYAVLLRQWETKGEEWLRGLRPSARATAIVVINSYRRFCGLEPLPYRAPKVQSSKRPHLSPEQILQLATLGPRNRGKTGWKSYLLALLLLDTGMRVSEALSLRVEDVYPQGALRIVGKGGKERYVFLSPLTLSVLGRYLKKAKLASGPLFPGRNGQPLTRNAAYLLIRNELERVGMKDGHPHVLRHSFAIQFLKNGGDLRRLQLLLGHSDLNTTAIYLNFIEEEVKDAHNKYGPFHFLANKAV